MMLKYFIESRKPHRPYLLTAQSLANKSGTSLIVAQEVQYGLYNPLPPSFLSVIDSDQYQAYRAETRRLFGEAFDAPAFTTFVDLADYFDASIQEVAKCLCIQRSLMQVWDRKIQTGTRPVIAEITEAFVTSFGPEYAFMYVLGQKLPSISVPTSSPALTPTCPEHPPAARLSPSPGQTPQSPAPHRSPSAGLRI